MPAGDDLSDYERLRIENIKRNEAFLASLGLDNIKPALQKKKAKVDEQVAEIKARSSKERNQHHRRAEQPVRRSSRIAGVKQADDADEEKNKGQRTEPEEEEQGDDTSIDYEIMPELPEQLDDSEFQTYINLRNWRLKRCRELQTEAYKIFQTRTLCEAIRRRRNDASFGAGDIVVWTEIWGIGSGKIRTEPERGWAWELRDELDKAENVELLAKSKLTFK
jgi:hypothetical protein